jgi:hypothetical protein
MNCDPLIAALIDVCVFFDTCDDGTVDPDAAVEQLELVALHVRNLDARTQQLFLEAARSLAEAEKSARGNSPRWQSLMLLGEHLGLVAAPE